MARKKDYFDFHKIVTVNQTRLKDIFHSISVKEQFKNNEDIFDYYFFKSFDTPESVADELYGSKKLWWIIALSNTFKDFLYDFPFTDTELRLLAEKQELVDEKGRTADVIYDALAEENDEKRRNIRVLKREFLTDFLDRTEDLLG